MNTREFKFLKDWAYGVAREILYQECDECPLYFKGKVQSIILESMSPAKGWKNAK